MPEPTEEWDEIDLMLFDFKQQCDEEQAKWSKGK
jgi:hypothetical protein